MSTAVPAAGLRIADDGWLSTVMERPVFRVDVGRGDIDGGLLTAHAASRQRAMYYAKVDIADVASVRDLSHAGMHVVDVSIILDFDPATGAPPAARPGIDVGDCRPEDAAAVLDIAGSCFRYSRFHADPDVPAHIAHRVKREWIANYMTGARGERLLVARIDGVPAGFLAIISAEEAGRRVRLIDLVGVDAGCQGRGVGGALVGAFLRETAPDLRRVATQAANTPSLRLYERCGFRVARAGYVLHMHTP